MYKYAPFIESNNPIPPNIIYSNSMIIIALLTPFFILVKLFAPRFWLQYVIIAVPKALKGHIKRLLSFTAAPIPFCASLATT